MKEKKESETEKIVVDPEEIKKLVKNIKKNYSEIYNNLEQLYNLKHKKEYYDILTVLELTHINEL